MDAIDKVVVSMLAICQAVFNIVLYLQVLIMIDEVKSLNKKR